MQRQQLIKELFFLLLLVTHQTQSVLQIAEQSRYDFQEPCGILWHLFELRYCGKVVNHLHCPRPCRTIGAFLGFDFDLIGLHLFQMLLTTFY